jgi:hypothetical protein
MTEALPGAAGKIRAGYITPHRKRYLCGAFSSRTVRTPGEGVLYFLVTR